MYSKIFERRPVESEREWAVTSRVEWRDADVARGKARRHAVMGQRPGEHDTVYTAGHLAHRVKLRPVPDEHRANVAATSFPQLADRRGEVDGAVPAAERPGKHRDRAGRPRKRRRARSAGLKPFGVSAPLELDDLRPRRVRREDCRSSA